MTSNESPRAAVRLARRGAWTRVAAGGALLLALGGVLVSCSAADPVRTLVGSGAVLQSEAYRAPDGADAAGAEGDDALPRAFSLRDIDGKNYVSPVRYQSPWGTCWGFAAIAASEASLMYARDMPSTPDDPDPIDLSERHLAWFTYTPLPDDDDSGQGGEGLHTTADSYRLYMGGETVYATSLFSSGIGPVYEERVPYANNEGAMEYDKYGYLAFSPDADWSVDEDLRFRQVIEFRESRVLPSPAQLDEEGRYVGHDAQAVDAVKRELAAGRAVSCAFKADRSHPGEATEHGLMNPGLGEESNGTWAHYSYRDPIGENAASHAVTIVGWDDDYARENFGNPTLEGDVDERRPPADGAWLVKNSWGAWGEDAPNHADWGTDEDGDGHGDGYFWLSYYDKSFCCPETFSFDVSSLDDPADFYINQYDYLPATRHYQIQDSESPVGMANVFTAEADQVVRALSCETTVPNTTVTYRLYRLADGASAPDEGELVAELQRTYEYGGFHKEDIAADRQLALAQGERFAVTVTQSYEAGGQARFVLSADVYCDETAAGLPGLDPATSTSVVNPGESFIGQQVGERWAWYDWTEVKRIVEEDAADRDETLSVDNPPIKAYADEA